MYKWTMEKGSFLVKTIEPPTLFVHFVYHSSLLRMCHWTEMYCRGAELRGLCQSLLFNLCFNPSGFKVFTFKTFTFSIYIYICT